MTETPAGASQEPAESSTGALTLMRQAARDGALDAREAATRVWSSTSLFASRFVYTTCYTLSYGVVFPSVLLANAIPRENAAVRGLIDGAQAAIQKVDQLRSGSLEPHSNGAVPTVAPA
jgi:hypothetical protein